MGYLFETDAAFRSDEGEGRCEDCGCFLMLLEAELGTVCAPCSGVALDF